MTAPATSGPQEPRPRRQPALHDLDCLVRAQCCALSDPSGQILASGVQGVFVGDRRALSTLTVVADGEQPTPLSATKLGSDAMEYVSALRQFDDTHSGPEVLLRRSRIVRPDGITEHLTVESYASRDIDLTLHLEVNTDLADIAEVKAGVIPEPATRNVLDHALHFTAPSVTVTCTLHGPATPVASPSGFTVPVPLSAGGNVTYEFNCAIRDTSHPSALPPPPQAPWRPLTLKPSNGPAGRLLAQSVSDLDALRLGDPQSPDDQFFAAGAPWYLTLFGRDSLWAARMSLALGTTMAEGTLKALARRQGRTDDTHTAEQPGKIIHEVRRQPASHALYTGGEYPGFKDPQLVIPSDYYGTVDATALWVLLLHDAWRWGLDPQVVEELLPTLVHAVKWLDTHARDDSGFLTYHDRSGQGFVNQGWKDSPDAIRFSDGTIAESPIALSEVQAYAHEAALAAATLLDAFNQAGSDRCRRLAAHLNDAFRRRFWVTDQHGAFPALALDSDGRPVDTVSSNMGHLLGTGLLTPAEEALVADRILDPSLNSGYGLRTLAADSTAYNPLSYHRGSVWVHDTAIAVAGLARTRANPKALEALLAGLLAAAPHFEYQMPELFGGQPREAGAPVPYPASCHPQAWAAAAGVFLATALSGIQPDVPAGHVILAPPLTPPPIGTFSLRGVNIAGSLLNVSVADHTVSAEWESPDHKPVVAIRTCS